MFQRRLQLMGVGALGALALAAATPAAAGPAEPVAFNIEAGPLETALIAYAAQSGRQILFDPALVAGLRAPALKEPMTAAEALRRLIGPAGLVIRQTGPNVFVLKPARSPAAEGAPGLHVLSGVGAAAQPATGPAEAVSAPAAEPPEPPLLDELVITGSLIRGLDAPASPVLVLDRDAMDRAGRATVADMLLALPQNFAGSGSPAASVLGSDPRATNDQAASGVNLRGLGASATLVLVNGRRMGGSGTRGDFADVSAIPSAVVERVDVLLDGASALYGSDAVGGVVNVILRRRMAGLESRLRIGTSTRGGAEELQASQTYGTSWRSGDLVLAYEYGKRWGLAVDEREVTASADLRPFGGTDRRTFYSHPGNILVFDPASRSFVPGWAIPQGQDGRGLQPSDFIAGAVNLESPIQGGDILPKEDRHSFYASVLQDFGDRVRLIADLRYSRRETEVARPNAISIFQVGANNPFFVSPDGSAAHVIGYSFADEIGPSLSFGRAESVGASAGLEIQLGGDWRADVYLASAHEIGRRDTERLVNSRFVNEAVGAIADDPLTAYRAAEHGYFNPFGDGAANDPAVLAFIGSGYSRSRNLSVVNTFDAKADGTLWSLPAGPLKAAVGAQARQERFKARSRNLVSTASPTTSGGLTFTRTIEAVFAEVHAPLIGAEMGVPGVHSLEATLAGRLERYGDFGETSNPKLGLIWRPQEQVKLRASYGTSFRAPNMPELHQLQNASPVLLGSGADQRLALVQTGGNPDLQPETATTWSFGIDYLSNAAPGLRLSATWFEVTFSEQIGQPVLSDIQNALRNPAYAAFVRRVDPTDPADLARIKAIMARSTSANIGLFPPEAYQAIIDARFVNTGEVRVRGADLSAAYGWSRAGHRFDLAANASYLADYVRRFTPTAEPVQLVDQAGQPAELRARIAGAWTRGAWGASLALNYVDDYQSETGRKIEAWTTADAQLRWTPAAGSGPLEGLALAVNVQNLFDADPPFYDSPLGIAYDPANADPLGRVVSLQLTKRW